MPLKDIGGKLVPCPPGDVDALEARQFPARYLQIRKSYPLVYFSDADAGECVGHMSPHMLHDHIQQFCSPGLLQRQGCLLDPDTNNEYRLRLEWFIQHQHSFGIVYAWARGHLDRKSVV